MRRVRGTMVLGLLIGAAWTAGCDGDSGADGGPGDAAPAGVELTVTAAAARGAIDGIAPRPGSQYYLLDVTFVARAVGPISVAPFALELELEDLTRVRGDAERTEAMEDGCRSRTVPMDATLNCRVAFIVAEDAAAPATLRWADANYDAAAAVPPLAAE